MTRLFGPKEPDHPSVGIPCAICDKPFAAGDYTTAVSVGPAGKEAQARMKEGRPYNAVCVEAHADCTHQGSLDDHGL